MASLNYVDENDKIIGVASFEEVRQKQLIFRLARVFMFDDQDRLYLQRRGMQMKSAPGLWDQSAGGHVDISETYQQAAARELAEELGVKDLRLSLFAKYYYEEPHPEFGLLKAFTSLYLTRYNGQPITLDPHEVMEGKWVTQTELEYWMQEKPDDFADGFRQAYKQFTGAK